MCVGSMFCSSIMNPAVVQGFLLKIYKDTNTWLTRMKRILIYAHYYAPDVASTGQILQDLAEGMTGEFDVTVICTVPSYMGSIAERYRKKRFYREKKNGVTLIRVPVPEFSKSSKRSRIINIITYYLNARKATHLVGDQEYVFAISQPPILGGMLGVYGKRVLRATDGNHPKLIYNIQDFNPEQIEAVGYLKAKPIINLLRWLDKRSCRQSDLIITVGRDLVETLKKRFKYEKVPNHKLINNWADESALYPLEDSNPKVVEFRSRYGLDDKFVFMYSGNLGLYYDLDGLIRVIEKFKNAKTKDGREVAFAFVGAGSMLNNLTEYKMEHQLDNVIFIPYQDKDKLIYSLNSADVHFCLSARGIKGVSCPSKFYGIAAVGKPVLAILEEGSEIEMLIRDIGCGRVAEPGHYDEIITILEEFLSCETDSFTVMGTKAREYMMKFLSMPTCINKYKRFISRL